jgi:cell division protein FtsL
MEPVTAVSLAASIVTFIAFASHIVSGTYEVYQSTSGMTEDNVHVENVVEELIDVTAHLSTTTPGRSRHEIALKSLAAECEDLSVKLQTLVHALKVSGNHTTWKSLKVKIKSMRKSKDIANLEKRLEDYRAQILTRLTLILRLVTYQ